MEDIDFEKLPKKERKRIKREFEEKRKEFGNKRNSVIKWSIVSLLVLLILLGATFLFKELNKPLPGQVMPDQGRNHVSEYEWSHFNYNSNPPTSGPHDPVWTKPGVYSQPQGDGHLVHSLEHGYIIISYNCEMKDQNSKIKNQNEGTGSAQMDDSCLKFVEKLKERVSGDLYKLVLVPRPTLDTNFALTAWTRIDKFDTQDGSIERVNKFISAFRNHGPEQTME